MSGTTQTVGSGLAEANSHLVAVVAFGQEMYCDGSPVYAGVAPALADGRALAIEHVDLVIVARLSVQLHRDTIEAPVRQFVGSAAGIR